MASTLALIGCGKMGQALLDGWLKKNLPYELTVIQPEPLPPEIQTDGFTYVQAPPTDQVFDVLVFAVKPQILNDVLKSYADSVHDTSLILSIAAGKSITTFESVFGASQPVIRAMPNTPAAIGQGITALCPNGSVSENQKHMAESLFQASGEVVWIENEPLMDAVTAISGSGPAYVFYLIEALAEAAQKLGLDQDQATRLARQTVIGAAALAKDEPGTDAATLRQNVTSPGGTTEAALNVLMDGTFQESLTQAVTAARDRGKELSS